MRRPNNETVPAVAGMSPTRIRPAVDLPEPDSPTSPSVSPGMTSKFTLSSAFSGDVPPAWPTMNVFLRQRTSTIGASAIDVTKGKHLGRAADGMQLPRRFDWRRRLQAAILYKPAPGREATPRDILLRPGDSAGNGREARGVAIEFRHRGHQPDGVGVDGSTEKLRDRRLLDDASRIHDDDALGELRNDTEVVRDQHHRHAEFLAQLAQKLEDLGLDGDVERSCRLIRNQKTRPARDGHRYHDPLAHAARQTMRVIVGAAAGIGNADKIEQLDRAAPRGRPGHFLVMTPRSCEISITDMPSSLRNSRKSSRIWAWMVTSSAVVGSSAIKRHSGQAIAIATMTLWRMPPDRRCG